MSVTTRTATAGTTDAVNIVFVNLRCVEVNDVADIWNVEPACSDIGCYKDAHFA